MWSAQSFERLPGAAQQTGREQVRRAVRIAGTVLGPGAPFADAVRALVDVERGADAVAGAVAVVEAQIPQRAPRQRVQREPRRVVREHHAARIADAPNVLLDQGQSGPSASTGQVSLNTVPGV